MKKHLLIIGTIDNLDATIEKILALDIDYTLFQKKELLTEKQLKTAKRVVVIDYTHVNEVIALAKSIHLEDMLDAVVSFTEYGLYPAALCAAALNIPSNKIKPVELTRSKVKMRSLLQQHNIGTIRFKQCDTLDDVKLFYREINEKPFILKPSESAGSRGVSLIQTLDDISTAWKHSTQAALGPMLAEEFIDGKEYSVESLTVNGQHEILAITEKLTTEIPHFIEIGHNSPALLPQLIFNDINRLVTQFLDLIEQDVGPAHTEIKIENNMPKIIESQTRIGGDQIWELTEITTGASATVETICHLCQINPPPRMKKNNAAAIRFFALENQDILDVIGIEKARELDQIVRIDCKLQPGQKVAALLSSASRQGYVLSTGETVDQAVKAAEKAKNMIEVVSSAPIPFL